MKFNKKKLKYIFILSSRNKTLVVRLKVIVEDITTRLDPNMRPKIDLAMVSKVNILLIFLKQITRHCVQKTSSTCPELCDCEVADETIKFSLEGLSRYKVSVVCTDLALTSLPQHLPPGTIYLNMANNQVQR